MRIAQTTGKKAVARLDLMGEAAMLNAYFICHNVQVKLII